MVTVKKLHMRDGDAVAKAVRELSRLRHQSKEVREDLTRLRLEVVEVEARMDNSLATQLAEANEQLLLTTLRAQSDADACGQALAEATKSAALDPLTGLPNRMLLLDRSSQAIARARRDGTRMAVMFLDLDNFKQINDTLGHTVGDDLLKVAAQRLASSIREADSVSRYGGDEFLVLLTEITEVADVALVAHKMMAALSAPYRVGEQTLRLAASIGISLYPDDGEQMDTLIHHADAAMYLAKEHGLGSFAFHGQEPPHERNLQSSALESLRRPLTHYELALVEHARASSELREANGQLVLAALSAQELAATAEQTQQHQKESLALVVHELRNPLTPIRVAAEMLSMVRAEEIPRYQAIIEQEVEHMSRLVSDLLDVARARTGKLRLERQLVDMAGIISEAVDACRPAMDTRQQHLGVQVPSRALELHGDPVRLAQIVRNLLDNASKYTPNGGQIELSVMVVEDAIEITVSDNGIGFTAGAQPRIFETFVQDPQAIGFNGVGLGIGLSVVHELVQAHGGTVTAASAGSGHGSQFVVTLPLENSESLA